MGALAVHGVSNGSIWFFGISCCQTWTLAAVHLLTIVRISVDKPS